MIQQTYYRFLRWPILFRLLLLALLLIISFGVAIHLVEPKRFPTIFDGVWWAVITTATVGYGDFYPVTIKGRSIGILLVLTGAGVLSAYFASLAASTIQTQNSIIKGKAIFNGKNHIIIIGWNGRSKSVIDQLLTIHFQKPIILIDDSLENSPYPNRNIHFIKGKPYVDETLKRAGLSSSELVLITADQHKTETHADMGTILILLAVKGINPEVYCITEILTTENVVNAKRGGADEVIQTTKQTSCSMMNSLLSHGMSDTILSLIDHLNDNHLAFIQVRDEWIGQTFQFISSILQKEEKILLGIKSGEVSRINPSPNLIVSSADELLVISK